MADHPGTPPLRSPEGSSPGPLFPLGKSVVFSALLPEVGRELFLSDGTAAGTRLIADLVPGPAGSDPEGLTALGNEVYFMSRGARGLWDLYQTDGSGVELVRRRLLYGLTALDNATIGGRLIFRTEDGSLVSLDPVTGIQESLARRRDGLGVNFGSSIIANSSGPSVPKLYFQSSVYGRTLGLGGWEGGLLVTDGTANGTLEIEGVTPVDIAVPYLGRIATLTIGRDHDYWDRRVLVTDGTASGTRFLPPNGALFIVGAAGRHLFLASGPDSVFALDERGQTRPLGVHLFTDWDRGRLLGDWGLVNGRLLFQGGRWPSPVQGEPFGTDGSSAELLGDLVPGPLVWCGGPTPWVCRGASLPHTFMEARRVTYFVAGESGHLAIWRTDGTLVGTAPTTSEYTYLENPLLRDQGIFFGAHRLETGYEPAFLPLHLPKAVQVPVAPCRLWSSDVLPGTKTNIAVEGHCGVPVGAYSVQVDLTATFADRTASTVRLAASGAVPPAAATRFFGPKASRATQTVNIGPHGITVWNDGPGPGAIRISLDVSGYEAPEN